MDQTDPSLLLTPAAAAKILAISVKQLTHLTVAGEMPFVNIGLVLLADTFQKTFTSSSQGGARRRCRWS